MPLLAGFYYSFPAACYKSLCSYPLYLDGFYTQKLNSLDKLLSCPAVQNLSPAYFECVCKSLQLLRKSEVYSTSLLESSYLIFTYTKVPLLVFKNASNEYSNSAVVIDMVYLVPHYITEELVVVKRWKIIGLLTGFLAYGLLNS
jgi:hypothetical protein